MIADSSDEGKRGRESGKWSAQDSGVTFECSRSVAGALPWDPVAEFKDRWNASGDLIPLPTAPTGSTPGPKSGRDGLV